MTDPRDDELRRLLDDAVSDVHPSGTPDDIRRRHEEGDPAMTTTPTGLRRWLPVSLAAAAAMVLVIGGTLWLTQGDEREQPPVASGSGTPDTTPSTTEQSPSPTEPTQTSEPDEKTEKSEQPAQTVTKAVPVYFAGDTAVGPRLFREFQKQQLCPEDSCLWVAAAKGAVDGTPADPDYRTLWPAGATVNEVQYDGDLITVDLADAPRQRAGLTADQAGIAVQGVIYSVQGAVGEGRKPVQLLVDGQRSDRILGVPTAEPLANAEPDATLAMVSIASPAQGEQVKSGFEVTGQAAAFEANVVWELRQGGTVVKEGFTTAEECCTLAPYTFTVDAPPGSYTLVVSETDPSGGEGRGVNQDTKDITIVP